MIKSVLEAVAGKQYLRKSISGLLLLLVKVNVTLGSQKGSQ